MIPLTLSDLCYRADFQELEKTLTAQSRGWGWRGGVGGGEVSSYMEVGTDVRPGWPPFSGLEIYLWVYFFILKYMSSPQIFRPRCMNDKLSFT